MFEHNIDDVYARTLSMDVLHINKYIVLVNTNNEVACHLIVWKFMCDTSLNIHVGLTFIIH